MIYQGSFRNVENEIINVSIDNGLGGETITIGENGLFFGETPVEIDTDFDNVFGVILSKSCTINLVTKDYIGTDLFASNPREIEVTISDSSNNVLFYGYIEANSYNQPFAKPLEEFEINCVDVLGTLENYKYKNTKLSNYNSKIQNANTITLKEVLVDCLTIGNETPNIYYDCSKGIEEGEEFSLFEDLKISEMVFYGDEFKKMWNKEDVLESVLKYLNLHILQEGKGFYIYDWEGLKTISNNQRIWYNITTNTQSTQTANVITFSGDLHKKDDTNISIGEVFNQINIKCETKDVENILSSPLDKNSLESLFTGKTRYMREYISEGDGERSAQGFYEMLHDIHPNHYINASFVDWWLQPVYNKKWQFHTANGEGDITDIYEKEDDVYINSYKVAKYVKEHTHTASIFQTGSVSQKAAISDNKVIGKLSSNNYIIISINGNGDITNNPYPSADDLIQNTPLIEYVGDSGGLVLSPNDEETTNYIVFSGQICLQPRMLQSGYYNNLMGLSEWEIKNQTAIVPSKNDKEHGRRYTVKYFTNKYTKDDDENTYLQNEVNLQLDTEDKSANNNLKYSYSVLPNHREDYVSKLPLLECELIIGNKRLIETDVQDDGSSVFQWVQIGNEPTYEFDGETYTLTTFSLGVNPKIDDEIIGTTFDLQNTIKVEDNLNTEGTGIPITKADAINGKMTFRILGVINTIWNNVTRRHPTWFRKVRYNNNDVPLLPLCESIIIKDFSAKFYSDNGGNSSLNSKDLLYQSNEYENAFKTKDVTFEIITQPTATDKKNLSITDGIYLNCVLSANGTPITELYNSITDETAKCEEHYIDYYFRELTSPKMQMECTISSESANWQNLFYSELLEKTFYVLKTETDLKKKTTTITIREI